MINNINKNEFKYLNTIIDALQIFYRNDYELLLNNRKTHEQTISFRIAMYLSQILENHKKEMYIDCEYHGDLFNPEGRKTIEIERHIRPDIIYHNRKYDNRFCIEMKVGSLVQKDVKVVNGLIYEYGYLEGYCICNIGKNYVTINAISSKYNGRGIRYRFKYDGTSKKLNLNNVVE